MNRSEFCELLVSKRIESGAKTSEISFSLKMLLPDLRRFESGKHNFNIEKLLSYLAVIGYNLVIVDGSKDIKVQDYKQLVDIMKDIRIKCGSLVSVSGKIGFSKQGISNVEVMRTKASIDFLLALLDLSGGSLKIEVDG